MGFSVIIKSERAITSYAGDIDVSQTQTRQQLLFLNDHLRSKTKKLSSADQ
jgi:hypothetical protein